MATLISLKGNRYGRLVVLDRSESTGKVRWNYLCDCGNTGTAQGGNLTSGAVRSCGCLASDLTRERRTSHGHKKGGVQSPTLRSWMSMKQRVLNPKNDAYHRYGGRGIAICERWMDFNNFLADMGERPEGTTLERRENDKGYEPGNCIWADFDTQSNNKRNQPKWLIDGELMNATQAWKHWGITFYATKKALTKLPVAAGPVPQWHSTYKEA